MGDFPRAPGSCSSEALGERCPAEDHLADVWQYIDAQADRAVEEFRRLLRHPSVAARGEGLDDCAQLLKDICVENGIAAELVSTDGGPPIVWAEIPGPPAAPTLLCYGHYDVQPAEPLEEWIVPPFAAEIIDGVVYARGATDNKGGVMAFVKASEAFLRVRGRPPVTLKLLFEGEEEIGSPHLESWLLANRDRCAADAMHCLDGGVDPCRRTPRVDLGLRALLYVELVVRTGNRDNYSGDAAYVPHAAWRLVHALRTTISPDGRILIEGWYDEYEPPGEEEQELARREVAQMDPRQVMAHFGIESFPYGRDLYSAYLERHYGATATICGLTSGYQGPGVKTIVPGWARAKLDFRLPPRMEPERQLERLREHLRRHGFGDVEVIPLTVRGYPFRCRVNNTFSQAVIRAAEKVFGSAPVVSGLTQEDLIYRHVPMPVALTGFGPPNCNLHAPNENMPIDYYIRGIKYATAIMDEFACAVKERGEGA